MNELEDRIDNIITVLESHAEDLANLKTDHQNLLAKVEDLENRDRRSNRRIRWISELYTDVSLVVDKILQEPMTGSLS